MNGVNDPPLFIKDIKPGLKNLNVVFIVLEIGKWGLQPAPLPPCVLGQEERAPQLQAWDSPPPPLRFPLPSPFPRGPGGPRRGSDLTCGENPGLDLFPPFHCAMIPEEDLELFWKSSLSNTPPCDF